MMRAGSAGKIEMDDRVDLAQQEAFDRFWRAMIAKALQKWTAVHDGAEALPADDPALPAAIRQEQAPAIKAQTPRPGRRLLAS
jgi:phytoene/squalene synthetase